VNDLFGVFIIDVHQRLVDQFLRIPDSDPPPMPVSEELARTLSPDGSWGQDPIKRNAMLREWEGKAAEALPRQRSAWDSLRWIPSATLLLWLLSTGARRLRRANSRNI
jgi:hypothetical protein